jgi:hypothetical protein
MRGLSSTKGDQMTVIRRSGKSALFCWVFLMALMFVGWGTGIGRTDRAILTVITDPEGAKVTVDTGEEGITPCTLEVPNGTRKLKIKKRAHIAARVVVEVSLEAPTEVKIKLLPTPTTMREGDHIYCKVPIFPQVASLLTISHTP